MPDLPATMTAIAIREPGGPEVLEPREIATPEPGHGEILIKVAAAGVNRPDTIQRMGLYPPPPGSPETPGLEVAGERPDHGARAVYATARTWSEGRLTDDVAIAVVKRVPVRLLVA